MYCFWFDLNIFLLQHIAIGIGHKFNNLDRPLPTVFKEEWDTSIVWRTSFRNKQWKLLFIDMYYLYFIL